MSRWPKEGRSPPWVSFNSRTIDRGWSVRAKSSPISSAGRPLEDDRNRSGSDFIPLATDQYPQQFPSQKEASQPAKALLRSAVLSSTSHVEMADGTSSIRETCRTKPSYINASTCWIRDPTGTAPVRFRSQWKHTSSERSVVVSEMDASAARGYAHGLLFSAQSGCHIRFGGHRVAPGLG
jgi:hypothetical protein